MSNFRVLLLGDSGVGKSALSVRYLTRRYLGEYMSDTDLLYRCGIQLENEFLALEILDPCTNVKMDTVCTDEQHILWSDAVIIMYSITSRDSFRTAFKMLQKLQVLKEKTLTSMILLGNKRDLLHRRNVSLVEGQRVAEKFGCQFYEISVAESFMGVSLAFESLLREIRALRLGSPKTLPRRAGLGLVSVSKMIGAMFGKTSKLKKRPSLSL